MSSQEDSELGLLELLAGLESDLRALGFIGTHKVLRLVKRLRELLVRDHHLES